MRERGRKRERDGDEGQGKVRRDEQDGSEDGERFFFTFVSFCSPSISTVIINSTIHKRYHKEVGLNICEGL